MGGTPSLIGTSTRPRRSARGSLRSSRRRSAIPAGSGCPTPAHRRRAPRGAHRFALVGPSVSDKPFQQELIDRGANASTAVVHLIIQLSRLPPRGSLGRARSGASARPWQRRHTSFSIPPPTLGT